MNSKTVSVIKVEIVAIFVLRISKVHVASAGSHEERT
jgi:hypothetical protein